MNQLIKNFLIVFHILLLGLLIGCSEQRYDEDADRTAITELREQEMVAFSAGDIYTLEKIFTSDIKMLPPNEPAVSGTEEFRSFAENMFSAIEVKGEYTSSDLTLLGDWAFERLTMNLTITPVAGGDPVTESGKCIHIYKRQSDGSWKIAQDIWNMDSPLVSQTVE